MNKHFTLLLLLLFLFTACSTHQYFHDQSSSKRQQELQKSRSGHVFGDIALSIASIFVLAAIDVDMGVIPTGQEFKKLKLINPTPDTMYINMLTDVYWDEDDYCDFMDLRLPPNKNCRILVPVEAAYNVYFSNTPDSEDDEMLEIFTGDIRKLSLYPGITMVADTVRVE